MRRNYLRFSDACDVQKAGRLKNCGQPADPVNRSGKHSLGHGVRRHDNGDARRFTRRLLQEALD